MKIALLADTHLAPGAGAFGANCVAALDWIQTEGADLIVHLGDVTADGHHHPSQIGFAAELLAAARMPLLCVPGNHDIGDNPTPGLEDSHGRVDPERLALFRQHFGDDHWAIDTGGWRLFGLNAQLFALGDASETAQFEWLESALAGVDCPCGLFLHKPLFRDTWEETVLHPRYAPLQARRRIKVAFEGHDLRFVVTGHTHQWRRHTVEGVEHIWAPSSAFVVPDLMQEWIGEKQVGVLMLTLSDTGHSIELARPVNLARHDLADHPEIYPALGPLLKELRDGKRYPRR